MKRQIGAVILTGLLIGVGVAWAAGLKTWSTNESVTASDLNGNFQYLNNVKVGGGKLLVNADVSASAAIAHSKLATPALVPKAWAQVGGTCSSSPCTITSSSGISAITRVSTGLYNVALSTTRANAAYAVIAVSEDDSGPTVACSANTPTTTSFTLSCSRMVAHQEFGGGFLSTGTKTITFGTAFAATPVCLATASSTNPVLVFTTSTTQVRIDGTGADAFYYWCREANNYFSVDKPFSFIVMDNDN